PNKLLVDGSTIYGSLGWGGRLGAGQIFKLNVDGTGFTELHAFANGFHLPRNPTEKLVLSGTTLYGITDDTLNATGDGILFKPGTAGPGFSVVHPCGGGAAGLAAAYGLTLDGTSLYGVTKRGGDQDTGVLYRIDTTTGAFTVLRSFAADEGADSAPIV